MPSHPERVRRNYHEIHVSVKSHEERRQRVVMMSVSHEEIASAMTAAELRSIIGHKVERALELFDDDRSAVGV